MFKTVVLFFLLAVLPLVSANVANAQSVQVVDITNRSLATGGTANLVREEDMFRINVRARGLTPDHAYILLLVAFNNPAACRIDTFQHCEFTVDSNALGGDPRVTSTTVHLTGGVADATGAALFNGKLEQGAAGLAGREVLEGTGVYNMSGAQLQVIIRDMGPFGGADGSIDGYGQTSRFGFGCNVNTCRNVQIATFD